MAEDFEAAVHFIAHYRPPPHESFSLSNDVKLKFYGLYKQATEGPCSACTKPRPSAFDIVGNRKYNAWAAHAVKKPDSAKREYVDELTALKNDWRQWPDVALMLPKGPAAAASVPESALSTPRSHSIISGSSAGSSPTPTPSAVQAVSAVRMSTNEQEAAVRSLQADMSKFRSPADASSLPPRSVGRMYDDFTTISSRQGTPATSTSSHQLRPDVGAQAEQSGTFASNLVSWLTTPSSSRRGGDRVDMPPDSASSALTTSPMQHFASHNRAADIRWSSSPNLVVSPAPGQRGSQDPEEALAVTRTAQLLQERVSHPDLSIMCAELQMQLAHQQLLLQAAQESLEFYVGSLHAEQQSVSRQLAADWVTLLWQGLRGMCAALLPPWHSRGIFNRKPLMVATVLLFLALAIARRRWRMQRSSV